MRTGRRERVRRIAVTVFCLLACIFVLAGVALAQERRLGGKFRSGSDVVVRPDERVPGDLYVFAGNARVEGRVAGDLVVFGGQLEIPGEVGGDVVAAGGDLDISGDVGGDVRAAGGRVATAGSTGEDLLVAAGQVLISAPARIGADLVFASGSMTMNGTVGGSALGSAGSYARGGTISGSEQVTVDEPEPEERAEPSISERLLGALRRYVAVVLFGALLLLLVPGAAQLVAEIARTQPVPSLGVGFLTAILLPIALLVLFLAAGLVSVLLGLLGLGSFAATVASGSVLVAASVTFAFVLVALFVADAIAGVATGDAILGPQTGAPRTRPFVAFALGAAVVVVLTALPVIGGIVKLVIVAVGLGALVQAARRRPPAPPPEEAAASASA